MLAITAQTLLTPLALIQQPLVLVEEGRIVEVASRRDRALPGGCPVTDFGDAVLAPGFIDIHIHGGAGHDVMEADPDALPALEHLLVRHGVSSYLPTTVTAALDTTLAALERLASAVERAESGTAHQDGLRARPLGIHLEGPFLSHARRGVHPSEQLQRPTLNCFERIWQAARGHIRLMTVAPELEGADEVIVEATRRGVCVSLGHSDSDLTTARSAMAAGARHATHTFNAMRPLGHRDPGLLGLVLTEPRMTADIIADGIHLDPTVVRLFLEAKGAERAVLISDATAATGMPDGRYRLGPLEVEVKDGRCMAGDRLAGSVLTLDRAVRNVMEFAGWDLPHAVRAATANPARVLGMETHRGVLMAGAAADLVVLGPAGDVRRTIVGGVVG